jgi:hypothetical protein
MRPPAAGPITDADCQAMLLIAIARGSTAGGTMFGAMALIAGPEKDARDAVQRGEAEQQVAASARRSR